MFEGGHTTIFSQKRCTAPGSPDLLHIRGSGPRENGMCAEMIPL